MPAGVYTLRQEQWVPRPVEEVFAFFSDANNLEELTPKFLGFQIIDTGAGPIHAGSLIRYRLRVHHVPIHWTTEILEWDPPRGFVDVELKGPYKMWHHTHRFEPERGGTRMTDEVRYSLPLGLLGRLAHALMVRADVQKIFDYRRKRIEELFGSAGA